MQERHASSNTVDDAGRASRVLIVDDQTVNLRLLRAQLEAEGKVVLEAANGVEALRVLECEAVDAVISDILMPSMDGFRLCLEIRKHAKFGALPFILYTSTYDSPEDRQLAQIVGADRYVVKPAPARALLDALHEASSLERGHPGAPRRLPDESYVLRQYSEALVYKLEEKNLELQAALAQLHEAHAAILRLNQELETRVQLRTAELQAANRELESFTYSVSHDLRAPLRAIGGYTAMLQRDQADTLPPEALQLLGRVEENTARMDRLIDDLLELSRLGRMTLNRQPVSLAHIVEESIAELEHERAGRDVEIAVGNLPVWPGDVILLKQAVLNLLANAVKYTRTRAAARIEIDADARGHELVCRVRDNGVGFDMRYADKLFEVFQRLHSQREFNGTGVGLAIVRRAIEKHGGRVWAESAPDCGATFYFTLPASQPPP